jgi:hypothetical protein
MTARPPILRAGPAAVSPAIWTGFLAALLAGSPAAVDPAVASDNGCDTLSWPSEPARAVMNAPGPIKAGSGEAVPVGAKAILLRLRPVTDASLPAKPQRAFAYAGWIRLVLPVPGPLEVALSRDAWVDVVQGNAAIPPDAYTSALGCVGLRSMARYAIPAKSAVLMVGAREPGEVRIVVRPAEP